MYKYIGYTFRIPYRRSTQPIVWLVDYDRKNMLDWFANHEEYILHDWIEEYLLRKPCDVSAEIVSLNRERKEIQKLLNNKKS